MYFSSHQFNFVWYFPNIFQNFIVSFSLSTAKKNLRKKPNILSTYNFLLTDFAYVSLCVCECLYTLFTSTILMYIVTVHICLYNVRSMFTIWYFIHFFSCKNFQNYKRMQKSFLTAPIPIILII